MHVLRNAHRSLRPRGRLLDIHPWNADAPISAGGRGLGFVEVHDFAPLAEGVERSLDEAVSERWLRELRRVDRHVLERYDDADELLDAASDWETLRVAPATRRRVRAATGPLEVLWPVRFTLFARAAPPGRRRGRGRA